MRFRTLLVFAYVLAVVTVSLQPFSGWRSPPEPAMSFLLAAPPRYIAGADILLNIIAYLPLGMLLYATLKRPRRPVARALAAVVLCGLLSVTMESIQVFLPTRIASNIDLAANTGGAALGVLLASFMPPAAAAQLRREWLRIGRDASTGLVIVVMWALVQSQPTLFVFGSGDLRDSLDLAAAYAYAPPTYLLAETAVATLATLAISLLTQSLLPARRPPWLPVATVLGGAILLKGLCAAAFDWPRPLPPGALLGLACGLLAFAACAGRGARTRAGIAAAALATGVLVVNLSPEFPYRVQPTFLLIAPATHWMNLSRILQTLSVLWPLLAFPYLVYLAAAPRSGRHARGAAGAGL